MTFIVTAIAAAVITTSTLVTARKSRAAQDKAAKRAEMKANQNEISARKSEVFAETEGEGIGSLGTISLEIDDDVDTKVKASSLGKSTVSI